MKVSKFLAAAGAVIFMTACILCSATGEVLLHDTRDFPTKSDWDIHQAEYTIFAKPPKGWVGDVMPMAGDEASGQLRLFYLQDWRDGAPTYHPFHSFVTDDFVHYACHNTRLTPLGERGSGKGERERETLRREGNASAASFPSRLGVSLSHSRPVKMSVGQTIKRE